MFVLVKSKFNLKARVIDEIADKIQITIPLHTDRIKLVGECRKVSNGG
jgi:hypothetical protein